MKRGFRDVWTLLGFSVYSGVQMDIDIHPHADDKFC